MANNNDIMNKFLQENLVYFLIPIIIIGAGGYFSYDKVNLLMQTNKELTDKQEMLETMKKIDGIMDAYLNNQIILRAQS